MKFKLFFIVAVITNANPIAAKDFTYPKVFTVQPNESLEQAQQKVENKRRCAKTWTIAGIVASTALDAHTTDYNQKHGYKEINPIYGKKATIGEIILYHSLTGILHYANVSKRARDYPEKTCKGSKISAGIMMLPGVINMSVRIKF